MPYKDPEQQAAYQRQVHYDRSRARSFYQAILCWAEKRRTPEGYKMLGAITRAAQKELAERRSAGTTEPVWPKSHDGRWDLPKGE